MNSLDSANWQVYQPRHKRRKPKRADDPDMLPANNSYVSPPLGLTGSVHPVNPENATKKSDTDLVADLISELNHNNLDPHDLTEVEVRLLQRKLGYAWYEILGYDEDPTAFK